MALLQFKGKSAHTRRLRAKAPRGGTATGSENWWLLQEQKGNACTWEREQITARPLHEQVWGWDKAAAQLRLGSRTPLSKLPSFIMKSSFCSVLEATRASEMGCMSQRCKVSMRLHAMEVEKGWARLLHCPSHRGPSQGNECTQFLEQAVCSYCSQVPSNS